MKRVLSLLGVAILVMAFAAACDTGGDDDSDSNDTGSNAEATVTVATSDTTPTEAALSEGTATEAQGTEAESTGTEAEGTGTEAESTGTEAEGTGTEGTAEGTMTGTEESHATGTEESTGTESEQATGTESEGTGSATEPRATGTEGSSASGTEAESTGTEPESTGTASEGDAGGMVQLGDTIDLNQISVTVNDFSAIELGDSFGLGNLISPDANSQFVGVEVTIENAGSDPVGATSLFSRMKLENADGDRYDFDVLATAAALLSNPDIATMSAIQAGDELTATVGYAIPADDDLSDYSLVILPDDNSGDETQVELQ